MKRSSVYILSLLMLSLTPASCKMGTDEPAQEAETDSLDVDSLGLEQLDLFEEETIPEAADELFADFLYLYTTNDEFRRQRTVRGLHPFSMNAERAMVVIYEREDDLLLQKDTTARNVIMEQIVWDADSIYRFNFSKVNGLWTLSSVEGVDMSNTPNASFLVFLRDFIADSLYRQESIRQPLIMSFYSEEDEAEVEQEMPLSDWNELYAELPDMSETIFNIDYGQSLISQIRKSMQLQELSNGLFLKLHFDFSDDRWQLFKIES